MVKAFRHLHGLQQVIKKDSQVFSFIWFTYQATAKNPMFSTSPTKDTKDTQMTNKLFSMDKQFRSN